jgi:uncharacterized protein (DUF58 family)
VIDLAELFVQVGDWFADKPFLLVGVLSLPFFALLLLRRTYPSTLFVVLVAIPTAATLFTLVRGDIFWFIIFFDFIVAAIAAVDLLTLPRLDQFTVARKIGRTASLKKPHRGELTISNVSKQARKLEVREDVPSAFTAAPDQFELRLEGRRRATVTYDLQATQRGAFFLQHVYLRVRSGLGLWRRHLVYNVEDQVNVYPDLQQLGQYALLARTNRLRLLGVRRSRRVGQDNEFERLRDYTLDDNYKHIDWRTTARRNKLTVKDFQTNQSQRLIFLIDCGRMMTNLSVGISLLDHALNAMLMLSYVALKQGDSVGLICFSDAVHSYVPAKGGMNQMNQLLHASYNRFPTLVESRYDQAFLHLSTRCRKRALVVLVTNVIDEVNSNQVELYLSSLVGRHLPLGVLMRDHALFDAADRGRPGGHGATYFEAGAASDVLLWRHQVIADLKARGVLAVDSFPEEMTAPLINQYLEIKARHLL